MCMVCTARIITMTLWAIAIISLKIHFITANAESSLLVMSCIRQMLRLRSVLVFPNTRFYGRNLIYTHYPKVIALLLHRKSDFEYSLGNCEVQMQLSNNDLLNARLYILSLRITKNIGNESSQL